MEGNAITLGNFIFNEAGTNQVSMPLTLTAVAQPFIIASGTDLTLSGVVSGTGLAPSVSGGGTVTLSANNTFSGTAVVDGSATGSTLSIGNVNNVFTGDGTSGVLLQNGGILQLTGNSTINPGSGHDLTIGIGGGTVDVEIANPGGGNWPAGNYFDLNQGSQLAGNGTLTLTGTGRMVVDNNYDSSFTGTTVINGGYLTVGNENGLGSGAVTVNSGGTLSLLNTSAFANNVTLNGGTLSAEDGDCTLNGTVTVNTPSTISLIDTWSPSSGHNITLSGQLTGSGDIAIPDGVAPENLYLTNNTNDLFGTITVGANDNLTSKSSTNAGSALGEASVTLAGGSLSLEDDDSGSNRTLNYGNNVTLTAPSMIDVSEASSSTNDTIQLGTLTADAGELNVTGAAGYGLGFSSVTLAGNATFNPISAPLILGNITDEGNGFTKTGSNTLELTGASSYSGATIIANGTLQAEAAGVLSPNSAVTVDQGAVLNLNGFNNTIGSLAGAGSVQLVAGTLTVGADNTCMTFAGTITGAPGVYFPNGFSAGQMQFNGSATLNGTALQLVPASNWQAGSVFLPVKMNITAFTSSFTFQFTGTPGQMADGLTFTIQGNSPTALGGNGGLEGYYGIGNSIAVKFDAYHNSPIGQTGLFTDGANPGLSGTNISGGLSLNSGDIMQVNMTCDGTTLSWTITDTANPSLTFSSSVVVNIPSLVGGNTAYVGFTAATGGLNMAVDVQTWNFIQTSMAPSSGLTKIGTGTLTLTSTNSPSTMGSTAVDGGTLLVNGSIGNVAVSSAVLGGTGTVGTITTTGNGTVSPGVVIGSLTAGATNLSGGNLLVQISGYGIPGTTYDCLNLGSNTLTLGGSSTLTLDLAGLNSLGTAVGIVSYGSETRTFATVTTIDNPYGLIPTVVYGSTGINVSFTSPTTTTVTPSVSSPVYGQNVSFTATVTSGATGTATGTVTFEDGITSIGTASLSGNVAIISTSTLTIGNHSIVVVYSGDSNWLASTSSVLTLTVNQATPTITWNTPAGITYGTAAERHAA